MAQSSLLSKLWAAPGSDAMASIAERAPVDPLDPASVARFVRAQGVDLVFIGPEAPLAAGVADAVREIGVPVFGPSRAAARLESSKAFAKEFMAAHGIPTARSRVCASAAEAMDAARALAGRCAVKADGLAAGKGVVVCGSVEEAERAVASLSTTVAGRILVEERLEGPELTVMTLVDGRGWASLPLSRDHKRLLDGDLGPNTGGMGAFCPAAIDTATWTRIQADVLDRTLSGLAKSGLEYRGALYAGIMLTQDGPKLLEYNARFGDPETQAVLPMLDADLVRLASDTAAARLTPGPLAAKAGAAVAVTLASPGYPDSPKAGSAIDLAGAEAFPDTLIFHAGTKKTASGWTATGGRALTVVGLGADAAAARERAYAAIGRVRAPELRCRRDVAASAHGRVS